MDIGLSVIVDRKSDHKLHCIYYVDSLLKENFKNKNYNIINHYWIITQVLKTEPGIERFAAIPRPRFVEHRRLRNLDNTFTDYYGVYTCGFKIDFEEYDAFIAASDEEAKRTIARKVVESLSNLDRLSKKAVGFDKERFKTDVIRLFQEHGLL